MKENEEILQCPKCGYFPIEKGLIFAKKLRYGNYECYFTTAKKEYVIPDRKFWSELARNLVKVTRCKDCQFWRPKKMYCTFHEMATDEDWYCFASNQIGMTGKEETND